MKQKLIERLKWLLSLLISNEVRSFNWRVFWVGWCSGWSAYFTAAFFVGQPVTYLLAGFLFAVCAKIAYSYRPYETTDIRPPGSPSE